MSLLEELENKNIKNFSNDELINLCDEIRNFLIKKVSEVGGHLASNIGIVELIVALHYVYDENDKYVFDGSHQSYVHKILTGRYEGFKNFKRNKEVTGLSNYHESVHDVFSIGHTSNSVALACGLVSGRNINCNNKNIICLIGDGSLSGSEAYSGLNNAAILNGQFLIVVNDNEQSISDNYGGLYDNLRNLRESNGSYKDNFFKSLGFRYEYIDEGNDVLKIIEKLNSIKNYNKPLVLHIHTIKGYGYEPAINNLAKFHFVDPFDIRTGEFNYDDVVGSNKRFISDYLTNYTKKNKNSIIINSGIPTILDLVNYGRMFPNNYIDTGICEDFSISYAAGLSKMGILPIVLHLSSFSQRMYDQLSQDICLNNLPIVLIIEGAGISCTDAAHLGLFDISLFSNIPNFIYMEPRDINDLKLMLDYSIKTKKSIGIRVVNGRQYDSNIKCKKIEYGKYEVINMGENVAIIALGSLFKLGLDIYNELKNLNPTLINPRFINILDEQLLDNISNNHKVIVVLENGSIEGGFAEKIDRFYSNKENIVLNYAFKCEFYDRIPINDNYEDNGIIKENIIGDIRKWIK